MRKALALTGLVLLTMLVYGKPLAAQSNSVEVIGVGGVPRASFYFGHVPNGQPGTTVLFVECDLKQATLTTNFDVNSQEQNSLPFPISCPTGPVWTVQNTPLTVTLTMYDLNWNPVGTVTLTINSASFTEATRYHKSVGSATITVQ